MHTSLLECTLPKKGTTLVYFLKKLALIRKAI